MALLDEIFGPGAGSATPVAGGAELEDQIRKLLAGMNVGGALKGSTTVGEVIGRNPELGRTPPPQAGQPVASPPSGSTPSVGPAQAPMPPAVAPASGMERLGAILQGLGDRNQGALARIGGAISAGPAFDRAKQTESMTVKMLMDKGKLDANAAQAISRNPALLNAIAPAMFGKGQMTDELREYAFDIEQRQKAGEKNLPSFGQWKSDLKKAGATNVSVNQQQESAFKKEVGKQQAERLGTLYKAGQSAQDMLNSYDAIEAGLKAYNESSWFGSGKIAPYEATLRGYAQHLGIGNADALSGAELAKSVQNRLALMMRNPDGGMGMPGALSDSDREFLRESQVGIDKSPEGNRKMLQVMRRMEQRKIDIAQMAEAYVAKHGTMDGFEKTVREYAKANPMFDDMKGAGAGGGDALSRARAAISKGANRDAVIQRLRSSGIDPAGL
jgi:hypothetical protein